MQMVHAGRMRVRGAVVLIDDPVAVVLRADSNLLASVLNAGALAVVALADATSTASSRPPTEAGSVDYVVLVSDLSECVTAQLLALQVGTHESSSSDPPLCL